MYKPGGRRGDGSPQILNLSAPQFWTSQPEELLGSKGLLFKLCCVCVSRSQSCLTCCKPMDCSPPGYTIHAILLAIKLEKVAIPFPRVSSRPRDWPWVSCIAGGFFTIWATREALKLPCLWYFVAAAWTETTPCTHYCSVAKSRPTLWDSMDCSTPGFPVLHYFLEFAQTHVPWVCDAIQPSHPLLPPLPVSTVRISWPVLFPLCSLTLASPHYFEGNQTLYNFIHKCLIRLSKRYALFHSDILLGKISSIQHN